MYGRRSDTRSRRPAAARGPRICNAGTGQRSNSIARLTAKATRSSPRRTLQTRLEATNTTRALAGHGDEVTASPTMVAHVELPHSTNEKAANTTEQGTKRTASGESTTGTHNRGVNGQDVRTRICEPAPRISSNHLIPRQVPIFTVAVWVCRVPLRNPRSAAIRTSAGACVCRPHRPRIVRSCHRRGTADQTCKEQHAQQRAAQRLPHFS